MKVLFVSNLFPDQHEPYRGLDNATVLHRLTPECEIRVLALRPSLPFKRRVSQPRSGDEALNPSYLPVPYVPKIGGPVNHLLAARALREPLREMRRKFAFDVVLGSWIYPDCCALSLLAEELQFPFVAIAQGSDVHQYLRMPVRRRIISQCLPRARHVITRSGELARLLGDAGIDLDKAGPVYNGIDFERFSPGSAEETRKALGLPVHVPVILFVGNFLPIKNPLHLVEAHAEICRDQQLAGAILVMVGGGPLEAEIRRKADALGFGKQVILAGRHDAANVARYMQAADLLCLPSQNEGVPNVILEAFACGLPVVASRVGGIPEVHSGDTMGRLFEAGNHAELCAALRDVLLTPPDRQAIHRHALQFSWDRAAASYLEILRRAADSNSSF